MKLGTLIILGSAFAFSVSCTHGNKVTKSEKEKIVKVDKEKVKLVKKTAYTCVVNKDTRLITLDKANKRCEIHYTKFGKKAQVAWAQATPSICSDVFSKIRTNIESRGFTCTTKLDKSRITASK